MSVRKRFCAVSGRSGRPTLFARVPLGSLLHDSSERPRDVRSACGCKLAAMTIDQSHRDMRATLPALERDIAGLRERKANLPAAVFDSWFADELDRLERGRAAILHHLPPRATSA